MEQKNWEDFVTLLTADPEIAEQLFAIEDRDAFAAQTLELGKRLGFEISMFDLTTAITNLRKAWIGRSSDLYNRL